MKAKFPLFLILVCAPFAALAQESVEPKKELLPNQQAFLNLPEEKREEFVKHMQKASELFQQKRIFEVMAELDEAEKIFADSPEILNLRGSCFVEMRAFDKALEQYEKASALAKDSSSIRFNIGEVLFVTKEWKKALEVFEQILKELPPEPIAMPRLVEFKIMLCKNKLGMKQEVEILSEKYDFLDDSPFHYYSKAALAYEANDLVKAEEWLAMANRIFQDPNILAPWQDTLVEYGYIKSFYGGDLGEVE